MIHYTKQKVLDLSKLFRLNLVNSLTGYKPGNLIGTVSENEITNLSIISSVVHIGSNPALLGFIMRPETVRRDTLDNIRESGFYTINHIHLDFIKNSHYTSAKFKKEESEFEKVGLLPEYLDGFHAPYVKKSKIKMGMKMLEEIPIKLNDTILIIGEVQHIYLPSAVVGKDGTLDLSIVEDICISGLNSYNSVSKVAEFPYARPIDFSHQLLS